MKNKELNFFLHIAKKIIWLFFYVLIFLLFSKESFSQIKKESDTSFVSNNKKLKLFEIPPKLHKGRTLGITTFGVTSYTTGMVLVSQLWYSNYEQGRFHFFNDNGEWNQMDKVGHIWTSYTEAFYVFEAYRWAGVKRSSAAWIGGGAAFVFQSGIEFFDGFSKKWGASIGDLLANTTGSAFFVAQELAWQEQRIWLKLSTRPVSYEDYPQAIQERTANLFGTKFQQTFLKDYNAQAYWLSINPASFMNQKNNKLKFPEWLNIAVGYGVGDVFGGFENKWTLDNGAEIDFSNIKRYRQFYLSLDLDLSRIKTRSRFWNFVLGGFNVLKIPAPTIEFNTKGEFKFHPIYF